MFSDFTGYFCFANSTLIFCIFVLFILDIIINYFPVAVRRAEHPAHSRSLQHVLILSVRRRRRFRVSRFTSLSLISISSIKWETIINLFSSRTVGGNESTGVIIKLVSPDYRTSEEALSTSSTTATTTTSEESTKSTEAVETGALSVRLQEGIKVSFSAGAVLEVVAGTEARLPLQYHELQQVTCALNLNFLYFLLCVFFVLSLFAPINSRHLAYPFVCLCVCI